MSVCDEESDEIADHEIHLFEPKAVTQAITDVIESSRAKTKLPAR
jgi:hypothetical protein